MSRTVSNLKPIPNQQFKVTIGDFEYGFRFTFCREFISYDLSINGEKILDGFRIVFGQLLITYPRLERDGNFILDIPEGSQPDYTQFGVSQFLRYLNQSETDQFRAIQKAGGL